MNHIQPLFIFLIISIGITFTSQSSFSKEIQFEELSQKVDMLEKKIDRINKMLKKRLTVVEQKLSSNGSNNSDEKQASVDFMKISNLVKNGKIKIARKQLTEFLKKYSTTRIATNARRLDAELSIFGKDAPKKWGLTKWFQGENEITQSNKKTTLLIFWETWCPYCKRDVPKQNNTYTDFKNKGLQVLGVTKINRSASHEKVNSFIKENDIKFPIAKEDGSLSTYFKISGVPAAAVISKGKIVWRGHPSRLSDEMLNGWL